MQRDGKAFFQLSIVIACENKGSLVKANSGEAGRDNHITQCQLQEGLSTTDPTEESSTGKNHQLQAPAGKDVHCMSYKKLTTPATQKLSSPPILAFLQWTFLQNNLSQLPPSLP